MACPLYEYPLCGMDLAIPNLEERESQDWPERCFRNSWANKVFHFLTSTVPALPSPHPLHMPLLSAFRLKPANVPEQHQKQPLNSCHSSLMIGLPLNRVVGPTRNNAELGASYGSCWPRCSKSLLWVVSCSLEASNGQPQSAKLVSTCSKQIQRYQWIHSGAMLYVALTMSQQLQRMFFRAKKTCRTRTFCRKYSHLSPSGNSVRDVGCFVQIQCGQQLDQGNIHVKGNKNHRLQIHPLPTLSRPCESACRKCGELLARRLSCTREVQGSSNVKHHNAQTARCPLRDACRRYLYNSNLWIYIYI